MLVHVLCVFLCVLSSFAIILLRKRNLVALLKLCCGVSVLCLGVCLRSMILALLGLKVIKLEFIFRLKIKPNDWLLADTCPQADNNCALF